MATGEGHRVKERLKITQWPAAISFAKIGLLTNWLNMCKEQLLSSMQISLSSTGPINLLLSFHMLFVYRF